MSSKDILVNFLKLVTDGKIDEADITMSTVHICRIKNSKIAEFWDCAQDIPSPPVNSDGPF